MQQVKIIIGEIMNSITKDTLGKLIKDARLNSQFTISELSKLVGVTNGHISLIENNKTSPSLELSLKLGHSLKLGIDQIIKYQQRRFDTELLRIKEEGDKLRQTKREKKLPNLAEA